MKILYVILGLLIVKPVYAAQAPEARKLVKQEIKEANAIKKNVLNKLDSDHPFVKALTHTYKTSPKLHAKIREQFMKAEDANLARAGWRPNIAASISGTANKQSNDGTIEKPAGSSQKVGLDNRTNNSATATRLEITQNLFNGGQTVHGTERAKLGVLAGEAGIIREEQNVILEAINAYLSLWKAQKVLQLRIVSEKFRKRTFDQLTAQMNVGEKSITEHAESKANYARAVAAVEDAKAELEKAYATYIQVIGQEPPTELVAPPNIDHHFNLPKTMIELKQRAQGYNPDVLEASYKMQSAEAKINEQEGRLLPSLDLSGSGGRQISKDGVGRNNLSRSHSRSNDALVKLSLTIPLYQRGQEWSYIRQANQEYYLNKNQFILAKRAAMQNSATTWRSWRAAATNVEQYKIAVQAAELNREGKLQEYLVGEVTLTDTLQAESQLVETQVSLIEAELKFLQLGYTLISLYGDLLPERLKLPVDRYDVKGYDETAGYTLMGTGTLYEDLEAGRLQDDPIHNINLQSNPNAYLDDLDSGSQNDLEGAPKPDEDLGRGHKPAGNIEMKKIQTQDKPSTKALM